uniref:PPM-type phosphatase domain-containing protein n=1 Tax=Rhizochromulina marina TaxID=1034831 RepID=A0A7S2WD43_9STRA
MAAILRNKAGSPLGTSLDAYAGGEGDETESIPGGMDHAESKIADVFPTKLRRGNTVTQIPGSKGAAKKKKPAGAGRESRGASRGTSTASRTQSRVRRNDDSKATQFSNNPDLPVIEKVSKYIASAGVPVVQFRTVQLPDGKLQLQRRAVRFFTDEREGNAKLRIVRASNDPRKGGATVIQTVITKQIQRVLLGAETMTMKRAVKDIPVGTDVKPVQEDSCLSLIYADEYMDFEVIEHSAVKASEFKLWLIDVSVENSMTEPPPPSADDPAAMGFGLPRLRVKRDDLTTDAANFVASTEYCLLPSMQDEMLRYRTRTAGFPSDVIGSVSCHGMEPSADDNSGRRGADTIHGKKNQDAGAVICPLLGDDMSTALFCVLDGHGEEGHHVSHFCMRRIAETLQKQRKQTLADPAEAMRSAFVQANEVLAQQHPQWGNHGGTTSVCVLLIGSQCWIANCGDSRFVIARRNRRTEPPTAIDISHDQTPLVPSEKERLTAEGGFVAQDENETEARVWLDSDMTCGLAMSRSLGDLPFKAIGVTAEPEVTKHVLTDADEFLIGASDGVWSVMSSQEAIELIHVQARGLGSESVHALRASQQVIREAARRWKDEEGDYRDDITALVVKIPAFLAAGQGASAGEAPRRRSSAKSLRRNSAPMMQPMKPGHRASTHRAPPPTWKGHRKSMASPAGGRKITL